MPLQDEQFTPSSHQTNGHKRDAESAELTPDLERSPKKDVKNQNIDNDVIDISYIPQQPIPQTELFHATTQLLDCIYKAEGRFKQIVKNNHAVPVLTKIRQDNFHKSVNSLINFFIALVPHKEFAPISSHSVTINSDQYNALISKLSVNQQQFILNLVQENHWYRFQWIIERTFTILLDQSNKLQSREGLLFLQGKNKSAEESFKKELYPIIDCLDILGVAALQLSKLVKDETKYQQPFIITKMSPYGIIPTLSDIKNAIHEARVNSIIANKTEIIQQSLNEFRASQKSSSQKTISPHIEHKLTGFIKTVDEIRIAQETLALALMNAKEKKSATLFWLSEDGKNLLGNIAISYNENSGINISFVGLSTCANLIENNKYRLDNVPYYVGTILEVSQRVEFISSYNLSDIAVQFLNIFNFQFTQSLSSMLDCETRITFANHEGDLNKPAISICTNKPSNPIFDRTNHLSSTQINSIMMIYQSKYLKMSHSYSIADTHQLVKNKIREAPNYTSSITTAIHTARNPISSHILLINIDAYAGSLNSTSGNDLSPKANPHWIIIVFKNKPIPETLKKTRYEYAMDIDFIDPMEGLPALKEIDAFEFDRTKAIPNDFPVALTNFLRALQENLQAKFDSQQKSIYHFYVTQKKPALVSTLEETGTFAINYALMKLLPEYQFMNTPLRSRMMQGFLYDRNQNLISKETNSNFSNTPGFIPIVGPQHIIIQASSPIQHNNTTEKNRKILPSAKIPPQKIIRVTPNSALAISEKTPASLTASSVALPDKNVSLMAEMAEFLGFPLTETAPSIPKNEEIKDEQYWYSAFDIDKILSDIYADSLIQVFGSITPYLRFTNYTNEVNEQFTVLENYLTKAILMANAFNRVSLIPINPMRNLELNESKFANGGGTHWIGIVVKKVFTLNPVATSYIEISYMDSVNYAPSTQNDTDIFPTLMSTQLYRGKFSTNTDLFLSVLSDEFIKNLNEKLSKKLKNNLPIQITLVALKQQYNSYDCGPWTIFNLTQRAIGNKPKAPIPTTHALALRQEHHEIKNHNTFIENKSKFIRNKMNTISANFSLDDMEILLSHYFNNLNANINFGNLPGCTSKLKELLQNAITKINIDPDCQSLFMIEYPTSRASSSTQNLYMGILVRFLNKTIYPNDVRKDINFIEIICIDPMGSVYQHPQFNGITDIDVPMTLREENIDFDCLEFSPKTNPSKINYLCPDMRNLMGILLSTVDDLETTVRNKIRITVTAAQHMKEPDYKKSAVLVIYNLICHAFDISFEYQCLKPSELNLNSMLLIFSGIIEEAKKIMQQTNVPPVNPSIIICINN